MMRSYSSRFKLMYSGVSKSIYTSENIVLVMEVERMNKMEDGMYNRWNCTLEGQKPEQCTHCGGIYEAELVLKENKDVSYIIEGTEETEKRRKCLEVM